ncbi:hypothetical protein EUX98_g9453 [Antrodiella citrinella]|uniref:HAT C-terminal dimerisation domain-containing protein n=1 Tax=Antrodiella citrinella TaxID=2447956 RepID=A0A4S4LTY6_9APHY|nr:hypothetical protein EUX98_g9453 [Antrodiella citrinella]
MVVFQFVHVIKELGVLHKAFSCSEHILNLGVQIGLTSLTDVQLEADLDPNSDELSRIASAALLADPDYYNALMNDPVAICRKLVSSCRASRQRHDDLQEVVRKGNTEKTFEDGIQLPCLELLRDMEVRWSSMFLMINRFIEMYPAIKKLAMSEKEFLYVLHTMQEWLAADKTPTLSRVLPMYEMLILVLRNMTGSRYFPKLTHAISATIKKLQTYLDKTRQTRSYVLAMIVNPTVKLKWMSDHWSVEDTAKARTWVFDAMMEYHIEMVADAALNSATGTGSSNSASQHSQASHTTSLSSAGRAALAQNSVFARLDNIMSFYSNPDTSAPSMTSATTKSSTPNQTETEEECTRWVALENKATVDKELTRYINGDIHSGSINLVAYWEAKQLEFPLLFRVAMDILPVQASSVPCEHVFSSSKETDTMRRSKLSPALIEILQILKYSFRQDRLTFTDQWIPNEWELTEDPVTTEEVSKLLNERKFDELLTLLNEQRARAPISFPVEADTE